VKGIRTARRAILVAAALAFVVSASACGGGGGSSSGTTSTGGQAAGGKKIKACLITDIGGLNDHGFNELAAKGLNQAKSQLGVQTRIIESHKNSDYIPNLQSCGRDGSDIIITNGFLMGDATYKAAKAFPDSNFAIIDFAYGASAEKFGTGDPKSPELPNLEGLVFKEEQPGYLVGYMAGLVTKSGTVSTVGGQKIPPVDHYIAGFQSGAKAANSSVKLLNGYSNEFPDPAPCKEIALNQISQGSDIVFQVAGQCGLGALDAAKEKKVWAIGVDKDQLYLGSYILTSALKRVDVAVFKTIQEAQQGKFEAGAKQYSLVNDGVGLGKVNPKVSQSIVDKVKAQEQKIRNGQIEVPNTVS